MRRFPSLFGLFLLLFSITHLSPNDPPQGICKGDCINGKGLFKFKDTLDSYKGSFKEGRFHGYGVLKLHRGKTPKDKFFDVYEGMFEGGQMEGEGIYTYANGDLIQGVFSKNKLNGPGTAKNGFIEKNLGYFYSGLFKDNKFNGYGIYKYPDKSFYLGEFEEGRMKGIGLLKNGKSFTFIDGFLKSGKPEKIISHNFGKKFYTKTGSKENLSLTPRENLLYGGEMEGENFSGVGFAIIDKKEILYGEWAENKLEGMGIKLGKDGTMFVGEFKGGLPDGEGILFDKDGDVIRYGTWEKGKEK